MNSRREMYFCIIDLHIEAALKRQKTTQKKTFIPFDIIKTHVLLLLDDNVSN